MSHRLVVTYRMPNVLTNDGHGLALQVTREARTAGLVEEDGEETSYRADVLVYAFEEVLLVCDRDTDRVSMADRIELVEILANSTGTIYRGAHGSVQHSGNGYRVHLPPAQDAGFAAGDSIPAHPAPGILLIAPIDGDVPTRDILSIRRSQNSN